jgi:hypothetical protein
MIHWPSSAAGGVADAVDGAVAAAGDLLGGVDRLQAANATAATAIATRPMRGVPIVFADFVPA